MPRVNTFEKLYHLIKLNATSMNAKIKLYSLCLVDLIQKIIFAKNSKYSLYVRKN